MQLRRSKWKPGRRSLGSKTCSGSVSDSSLRLSPTSHSAKLAASALCLSLMFGGCDSSRDGPLAAVASPAPQLRVDPVLLQPVPQKVCLRRKPEKEYSVKELLSARACEEDQKRRIEVKLIALQRSVREWNRPSMLGHAERAEEPEGYRD